MAGIAQGNRQGEGAKHMVNLFLFAQPVPVGVLFLYLFLYLKFDIFTVHKSPHKG